MSHEIWLLDHSASMTGERYRRLVAGLAVLHPANPTVKLIAFSHLITPILRPEDFPPASGSTAMHLALEAALVEFPGKVVVWSDGRPDDAGATLAAARALPGIVDTLFFGDEEDRVAREFMEQLARDNGGRWVSRDILRGETLLCDEVRELLGLPAPIAS